MKKLLLALTIWSLGSAAAYAQSTYDLEFFNFRLEQNSVKKDSVNKHCDYDLVGAIRNNGPQGFTGFTGMVFNVYVHHDTSAIDYATIKPSFKLSAIDLPSIPVNGSVNIKRSFNIDHHFKADTTNIVIVWPSDTYSDDNAGNNFVRITEWVNADTTKCAAGISTVTGSLPFNIYPNPAAGDVTLSFPRLTADGILILTDVMGHTIYNLPVAKGTSSLTLPVSKSMADGTYFVNLRSGEKSGISRLQILH